MKMMMMMMKKGSSKGVVGCGKEVGMFWRWKKGREGAVKGEEVKKEGGGEG